MSEEVQKHKDSDNGSLANVEKILTEVDPNIFEGIPKLKKQQIIKGFVVTMHCINPLKTRQKFDIG